MVTDPLQGWIAVRRPLDFERQQEYHVKIRATDGVNTDEFVVTVRIQDSNDLDPAFEYAGCQRISNVCINPRYTATCYLRQAGGTLKSYPNPSAPTIATRYAIPSVIAFSPKVRTSSMSDKCTIGNKIKTK